MPVLPVCVCARPHRHKKAHDCPWSVQSLTRPSRSAPSKPDCPCISSGRPKIHGGGGRRDRKTRPNPAHQWQERGNNGGRDGCLACNNSIVNIANKQPKNTLGQTIVDRVHELAAFSEQPDGLTRAYLTEEHKQANRLVAAWMADLGMNPRTDAAGNVIGRFEVEDADAPALLLGSHLDSVRNAGRYDGPLGVVLPLVCLQALKTAGRKPTVNIEVVGFGDEEGVRFGATLIGSRAMAGTLDIATLDNTDGHGTTMAEALASFGLDANRIGDAAKPPCNLHGYVEVHIEQGPVLEDENLAVGVVTAIAGASRFIISITGKAGHAGTVPMRMRRDAAAAAAEMVLLCESLALESDELVATTGQLEVPNGAVNVIAGAATFSLDVRSGKDRQRLAAVASIQRGFEAIAERRKVTFDMQLIHEGDAATCSEDLRAQLGKAVSANGLPVRELPSGAGHDAMAIAAITQVGMLFVRCEGGISHHPAEAMTVQDAQTAAEVMLRFLEGFRPPAP
jgi:allantoate deiminase